MRLELGISSRDGLGILAAGVIGAAAFPPIGWWSLSLLSLCLFLLLIRGRGAAQARQLGIFYGFVFGLGTMHWLFGMFQFRAFFLIGLMAGYFGLLGTLIGLTKGSPPLLRAALCAMFAVAVEWLRGDAWYLRFPWYTPPHALAQSPAWIAPTRWVGTYGLSYLLWLIAAAGALRSFWYWLAFCLVPVAALLLPAFEAPDKQALLVQVEAPRSVDSLLAAIDTQEVHLVALPEYAYPYSLDKALTSKHGPAALARKLACPVIFGSVEGTYGQPGFQNVAAVLAADGSLLGTFPKQRPVPLMVDGKPGTRRPVFATDHGILGIGLCYDFDAPAIAGSLVENGATVLIVPTGDLMEWGRIQHLHHELLVRLRAVETDRWILRPTSSGRSEVVDPHGVPAPEGLEFGEAGHIKVRFAHRTTFALGSRLYLVGPTAAVLTGCFVCLSGVRFYRSARRRPPFLERPFNRGS